MNKLVYASAGAALIAGAITAAASSHREAPMIAEDQFIDNTDVYAFISPTDSSKLTIVADYVPLLLPASGPNFYKFADDARYEVHIDNDGDAIPDLTYRWEFDTTIKNGSTFLYNLGTISSITDPNLNVIQTYTLWKIDEHTGHKTQVMSNVPVAPWNVGKRTFPNSSYEGVARQAIATAGGTTSFAGPRDEPFFVDLHVFDLLGVAGAHTTDGLNVMSLVLEVPITDIASNGQRPAAGATGKSSVVGIYASASRPEIRILRKSRDHDSYGKYIQLSRLGWPLVNEVIIPLQDKDHYNHSDPVDDVANFGAYILDPEVPKLLNLVLGANCAPTPPGGRTDIVGLLSPAGTAAADLLRIDIAADQTNAQSHFPNGRALTDDVTDTLLTVACNNGQAIGDGVNANDLPFQTTFPYLASPWSGDPVKTALMIALAAASLCACRGRDDTDVPSSDVVAARPVLQYATQGDLARELDQARRHNTWSEVRHRWQGQELSWTVTRHRSLCRDAAACYVAAFPVERPAKHGWMPALKFAPGEYAKLDAACGAAESCELQFRGTLGDLQGSADKPTSLRFSDVRVVSARAG